MCINELVCVYIYVQAYMCVYGGIDKNQFVCVYTHMYRNICIYASVFLIHAHGETFVCTQIFTKISMCTYQIHMSVTREIRPDGGKHMHTKRQRRERKRH